MPAIVKSTLIDPRYPNGIYVDLDVLRKSREIKRLLSEGPEVLDIMEGRGEITLGPFEYDTIILLMDYISYYDDQIFIPGSVMDWEIEYVNEMLVKDFIKFADLARVLKVDTAINLADFYAGLFMNIH